jgi:hypothetical protein
VAGDAYEYYDDDPRLTLEIRQKLIELLKDNLDTLTPPANAHYLNFGCLLALLLLEAVKVTRRAAKTAAKAVKAAKATANINWVN